MPAHEWRNLLSKHGTVLLPAIKDQNLKNIVGKVLDYLEEIAFIAYLPVSISTNYKQGLLFRLRILCFLFFKYAGILLKDNHSTNGYSYIHSIAMHFPGIFHFHFSFYNTIFKSAI